MMPVSHGRAIHTASLTGLAPGQVYYVRVLSINSAGRGAPTVAAFADAGTPAIAPWLAADAIPVGSVQLSTLPASGDVVGVGESSSSLKVIHSPVSLRTVSLLTPVYVYVFVGVVRGAAGRPRCPRDGLPGGVVGRHGARGPGGRHHHAGRRRLRRRALLAQRLAHGLPARRPLRRCAEPYLLTILGKPHSTQSLSFVSRQTRCAAPFKPWPRCASPTSAAPT